jgi:hypothetical protein
MKTDKERIAELTHALNELYEASCEYYDDYFKPTSDKLESALKQADKILEGS